MADFQIRRTVWLHNKPWRTGSEDALEAAGFAEEQKADQARRGAIVMLSSKSVEVYPSIAEVQGDVAVNALEEYTVKELRVMAEEHGVDLAGAKRKADIISAITQAIPATN